MICFRHELLIPEIGRWNSITIEPVLRSHFPQKHSTCHNTYWLYIKYNYIYLYTIDTYITAYQSNIMYPHGVQGNFWHPLSPVWCSLRVECLEMTLSIILICLLQERQPAALKMSHVFVINGFVLTAGCKVLYVLLTSHLLDVLFESSVSFQILVWEPVWLSLWNQEYIVDKKRGLKQKECELDYLLLLLKAMKIPLSLMDGQLVARDTQLCNSKLNYSLW